jgi:hypothetical protein
MADYPTVVLNDRPYALLVSHEVDRPAVYYGPSVPGATAVTFFMRAYNTVTLAYVYWQVPDMPDFVGYESGHLPVNLSNATVLKVTRI